MSTGTLVQEPPLVVRPGLRRPRRRRTAVLVTVGVLTLLTGAGFATVHAVDAAALSQVRVFLDGRSLTCADPDDVTAVPRGDGEDDGDESYAVPAVRGVTDLDCRLSVVVQNDSDRELDVQRARFTLLGPDSRVGLRTDYTFTQGLRPYPTGDRDDVVYDWVADPDNRAPVPVRAASIHRFDFHLVSSGCRQAGASTTWDGSPVFTGSIGTATADLPLGGAGFGFIGAKTSVQPCR